MTDVETRSYGSDGEQEYEKHRLTATVGESIEIPGGATAITITELSPFGNTVQVSWLQPVPAVDKGVVNRGVVQSLRTDYTDENPVCLPYWSWAMTVYEPPDTTETVIYWIE
jgi:hypothetical protein